MLTNCTNCGANLALERYQDLLTCKYCDTTHVPSLVEDTLIKKLTGVSSNVDCSLCAAELQHAKLGASTFLYCSDCRGLLIDQKELFDLITYVRLEADSSERTPEPIKASDLEREIDCPSCKKCMVAHEYYGPGDFVIDWCSSCNKVWLDGGELARTSNIKWGGSLWA